MIIFLLFAYKAWNSHKLEPLVPPIHGVRASYVHQLHLRRSSEIFMPNKLYVPTQ